MSKLYKFMRFRDDPNVAQPNENVRRLLVNSEIRVSKSSEFNDPYDCAPIIRPWTGQLLEQQIEKYVASVPGFETLAAGTQEQLRAASRNASHSLAQTAFSSTRDQWGIYSLSASYQSVLMWAHYADSYRGLCAEFEMNPEIFGKAEGVVYSDSRPIADVADSYGDEATRRRFYTAALLTKASDWAYEREHRLLMKGVHGFIDFEPYLLTGLILGGRMPLEDVAQVLDLARKRSVVPKIWLTNVSEDQFRVDRESISEEAE